MRLAWFSPMPPVRSGVAACSADLVAALGAEHTIDVFVADPSATPHRPAHEFVWRHRQQPYDLTVYQLGNSAHHDYIWPYLFRYPGLAVLHDVHLHHARAALLLREGRADDYRAEFAGSEPGTNPAAAELAVAGFDSHLLYAWPFTQLAVSASRAVAVHSRLMREALAASHPGVPVSHVRLGHGVRLTATELVDRGGRARDRWGIAPEAMVFGCFGGLTPDKRLPQILDAFAGMLRSTPGARLLLAGAPAAHYDVRAAVDRHGLGDATVVTGYLEQEDDLTDCIAASDVTMNLRWPTAREVSGPWLRCLAAGRPSVVMDLAHLADVPTLDPRTWTTTGGTPASPVAVGIDILDEDHSLGLAMRRLARDAPLRHRLGRAARDYWEREHSLRAMTDDYGRLLPLAAAAPHPAPSLPPHLLDDRSGLLTRVLEGVGVPVPWSKI